MGVPILPSANSPDRLVRRFARLRQKTWVQRAVLHLLVLATLVCRRPQSIFHAQFWAEDGSTFFADQVNLGFWHALSVPYAGYLHVIPRLVAGTLSLLKIAWIPTAYGIVAVVIATVCCSALSWPTFRFLIHSDGLRCVACFLVAAAIPTGAELIGSLCDLQWFLAPFALLLLFAEWQGTAPESGTPWVSHLKKPAEWASIITLTLIALSAPVLFITIPLLVWQLVRGGAWKKLRAALVMAGLAIQLSVLLHTGAGGEKHHLNFNALLISTVAACLSKSILGPLLGRTFLAGSARSIMTKLIITLIVSVHLMTALFIYLGNWRRRAVLLTAAYMSIAAVAVAIIGRNLYSAFLYPTYIPLAEGYRYFFVSSCLFIFIVALGADHLVSQTLRPSSRWFVIGIVLLLFSSGVAQNFRTQPLVDLSWSYYAAEIEEWEHLQQQRQPVVGIQIPLNPPPFQIQLNPHNAQ